MAAASMPDYYSILGIEETATDAEVKKAYRQLCRTAHPDVGGNPALFQMISLAYDALKDAASRKEYDRTLASQTPTNGYAEQDVIAALAEQEKALRVRWEEEARAQQRLNAPQTAPSPDAPEYNLGKTTKAPRKPDQSINENKAFRRARIRGYFYTGLIFGIFYLTRALDIFEPFNPGSGPINKIADVLGSGFNLTLLGVMIALGCTLEHFLAPSLRVIATPGEATRRVAAALLFWVPVVGEYLATTGGQIVAGVGASIFILVPYFIPKKLHYKIWQLKENTIKKFQRKKRP